MTIRDGDDTEARLDAQLRSLPREIDPPRDLWPGIAARVEGDAAAANGRGRSRWLVQAAAAVLLVAGSSLLTAKLVERGAAPAQTARAQPPATAMSEGTIGAMPAAFGPNVRLDPEYMAARRQLTMMLQARLAKMPPSTRAKLEANLAEMSRAAEEINAALAEQPGDPLLQELLLKTYQDELAVLANVNQLTTGIAGAAGAPEKAKRMKL
jgi:hypothetical protein